MMQEKTTNFDSDDLNALQANLSLLATDFEILKNHLSGYTEEGIYNECLEGIREPMAEFSHMIRSGQLTLEMTAKIFDCYYLMEALARYPNNTNNARSFQSDESWNEVRQLAKEAASALEGAAKKE